MGGAEQRKSKENGEVRQDGAPALRFAPATSRGRMAVWSGRRALCFAAVLSVVGWAAILAMLWMVLG